MLPCWVYLQLNLFNVHAKEDYCMARSYLTAHYNVMKLWWG